MAEWTLDEAITKALELKRQTVEGGSVVAFRELEAQVSALENEGYPISCIVPAGEDEGLGLSLKRTDGATFFGIYCKIIRKKLCGEGGEFNTLIRSGVQSSVGAILTYIVTALGVPAVALGVLVPIAVVIANTGLEAFCELSEEAT